MVPPLCHSVYVWQIYIVVRVRYIDIRVDLKRDIGEQAPLSARRFSACNQSPVPSSLLGKGTLVNYSVWGWDWIMYRSIELANFPRKRLLAFARMTVIMRLQFADRYRRRTLRICEIKNMYSLLEKEFHWYETLITSLLARYILTGERHI